MTKPNSIVNLPHIDEDGYFDGLCSCMYGPDGELMLGADTFNIAAPDSDGQHFYKLSDDKVSWIAEPIPTTAAECVGLVLPHEKQTARMHALRKVFEEVTKDSTEYRLVQDPITNAKSVEKIPEKTLDEVRSEKHAELKSAFAAWGNEDGTLVSSLGYEIDSDRRAMQDVSGLVTKYQRILDKAKAAGESVSETELLPDVIFMDADNVGHEVSLANLKVMQDEITGSGDVAYKQKWAIRNAINAATTKEELEAIVIKFEPADFSKGA